MLAFLAFNPVTSPSLPLATCYLVNHSKLVIFLFTCAHLDVTDEWRGKAGLEGGVVSVRRVLIDVDPSRSFPFQEMTEEVFVH